MSKAQASSRLAQLAHHAVHGSLTEQQHAELQTLLLEQPELRQQYFLLVDLEYGLAQLAAEETSSQSLGSSQPISGRSPGPKHRTRPAAPFYLALAVCLAGLLLVPFAWWEGNSLWQGNPDTAKQANTATPSRQPGEPTDTAASDGRSLRPRWQELLGDIAQAEVAVPEAMPADMILAQSDRSRFFGEPRSLAAGDPLELNRDYALVEGSVQLRSRTGAEMIVQAPAVFSIYSAEQVLLKVGSCSVYAPEGAEGFRVRTPRAEVVDKGTRFSITVAESGEADVEVVEGAAEVFASNQSATSPKPGLLLEAGEGSIIDFNGQITSQTMASVGRNYRSGLADRIVDYGVSADDSDRPNLLLDVTVQRGGTIYHYPVEELIGFDLIHFKAGGNANNLSTPLDFVEPAEGDGSRSRAATLDRSSLLTDGVLNPGGSELPLANDPDWTGTDLNERTPGFAVRFHEPVINGPGPDVVFFDLHVVVHPEKGDPFHVSPTRFQPGLRSHTIRSYDISLADRAAHQLTDFRLYKFETRIHSLDQLLTGRHNGGIEHQVPAKVIAVGIDLSDLGYPDGAEVSELFFQDVLDDSNLIDPVFIGGLPPTNEPSTRPSENHG